MGRGRKRKTEDTPATEKKAKKGKAKKGDDEEEPETTFSDYDSAGGSTEPLRKNKGKDSPAKENTTVSSKQQNAVSAALAAGVPAGQQRSVSCVADTSTQREVVVECFAPYDDHRWVNIGKVTNILEVVRLVVVVVVIMVVHGQGEDAYNHENVFFLKMKRKYLEPRMIFWYRNATRWLPMRCSTPEL